MRFLICLIGAVMLSAVAAAQQAAPSVKVDPQIFDRYAGYFAGDPKSNPDFVVGISRVESRFIAQVVGQGRIDLTTISERQFSYYVRDAQATVVLTFVPDNTGQFNQLNVRQPEGETVLKRTDGRTAQDIADRAALNAWFGPASSRGVSPGPGVPLMPKWELVARTATSIPLGTVTPPKAPASVTTIALEKYGYVEEEYIYSGIGNIYAPGGRTVWKIDMPYTTRMLVRRPADVKKFSGTIHMEPARDLNEWTTTLMDAWPYFVRRGDVFVAWSMAKGNVDTLLKKFDPARYAAISIPANGLRWDIMAQTAWMLRSPEGPLGKLGYVSAAAQKTGGLRVYSTGSSLTAEMQGYFINEGHHARARTPGGEAVIDGYVPVMNLQRIAPQEDTFVMRVLSEFEYANPGTYDTPGAWVSRPSFGGARVNYREYHIAGTGHADPTQQAQFSVPYFQLGMSDSVTARCAQPFSTTSGKAPVIRALYAALEDWVREGKNPPPTRMFMLDPEHLPVRDKDGNVVGSIRPHWIGVPTSRFMVDNRPADKNSAVSAGVCRLHGYEVPFPKERLAAMYKDRAEYLTKVDAHLQKMVQQRWLLAEDVEAERKHAASLSVP